MHAADLMTPDVICATPDSTLPELIRLMLHHAISALPIVEDDRLVGIVSEGDLLRRPEVGTETRRSTWLGLLTSSDALAADFVRTHGRRAADIMTRDVATVDVSTPIAEIVHLLEDRRIKRVPVLRDGRLVGIVSRRNLLQSLAAKLAAPPVTAEDRSICDAFYARLSAQPWMDAAASINAMAADGVLHLCGFAPKGVKRQALVVLAETVPGVRAVEDHLAQPREYDPFDRPNWPTAIRP